MQEVLLPVFLIITSLQPKMVLPKSCYFSQASQDSPTGWIDVIGNCIEPDGLCFSGYNSISAYYHKSVGWWRVLHTENECLAKDDVNFQIFCNISNFSSGKFLMPHDFILFHKLRKKLVCNDLPLEGCFRDKNLYKNFFLCWCSGENCNTRRKITDIYKAPNNLYIVGGGCKPSEV
ncbi:unnamed protein product [Thelazia callipaeda]|uniref:Protein quiver n=1 Tax=Thelazia callipaeda TaxID=103827 RepID=A0A0N5CJA3_THECL|nr:unnamed protein product [Thelazia callipaeda]